VLILRFRSAIPVPNSNPIPNPFHITLAMAAPSYGGPSPDIVAYISTVRVQQKIYLLTYLLS